MLNGQRGWPILRSQIRFERDIVTARQKARKLASLLGFDNQDQARLATAVSELARNVFQYAGTGSVEFNFETSSPQMLYIQVSDSGPGIRDLKSIMDGSYVSKSGMGVGLLGSKKLMDDFEIRSEIGKGTTVIVGKRLERRAPEIQKEQLPHIAGQLATSDADNPFEEIQNQNRELLEALELLRVKNQEIEELNNELEETNKGVLALYAELDEKARSLQTANEVKTSFLSNMTHEFRTPLSSIISLTRLLLDRVDGDLTAEQERQVRYIRKSGDSLLELVNDLLDLAKVEAGKVSITSSSFHVEELLSGLRGMFRPILAERSDLEFKFEWSERLPEFESDQAKISQVLRNLISNAIKFTERGHVRVAAFCEDKMHVHFIVEDTGIGIPSEYLETIFEDFTQVDSKVQRNQKGTGLGLPLSRKLARLLGGDLWVESVPQKGSTFHFVVPRIYTGVGEGILVRSASEGLSQRELSWGSSNFKILIIDDDETSRYILKSLVRSEITADFIEATSGADGLKLMKELKPDAVFLDLNMPIADGFEVIERVLGDQELAEIPVIINTARKLSEQERQFLGTKAAAILSKERADQGEAIRALQEALKRAGFDYKKCE